MKATLKRQQVYQAGLTIIELVAVIVISGIMATGVVTYVLRSAQGIASSASRNQLATTGRVAIDRLAMELHNALPGSIRRTSFSGRECIEFVPIRGASSYIDPPFSTAATSFDVVDFSPSLHGASDGYAVIYPNDQSELYAGDIGSSSGWPNFADRGPIQTLTSIADSANADQSTITLTKSHRFNRRSPVSRFFVVDDPVSYCMSGSNLYRYTNYGFYTSQVTTEEAAGVCEVAANQRCLPNYAAAPDKMLITNNVDSAASSFSVGSQTLNRNALIAINMTFVANGDSITLSHEISSRSVP